MNVKNLKISTRMLGTFGLLVLLLLAVVAAALVQLRSMRTSMEVITGNAMPSVEVINQIGTDVVRTRLLEVRHVNNDDVAYKTDSESSWSNCNAAWPSARRPTSRCCPPTKSEGSTPNCSRNASATSN